jgi:hypothetical protein
VRDRRPQKGATMTETVAPAEGTVIAVRGALVEVG